MSSKKVVPCVLAGLTLMLAPSLAMAEFVTVAQWNFESGAFLADSAGSYTLANGGAVQSGDTPDGSTGSASFAGGTTIMSSTSSIDLSSYDSVKISWWQKVAGTATGAIFETSDNHNNNIGAIANFVNSSGVGGAGNAYAAFKGTNGATPAYVADKYAFTANAWQKFSVVYTPDEFNPGIPADDVVVYDGSGVETGVYYLGDLSATSPLGNYTFNIGNRGATFNVPLVGLIDNLTIEGNIVPEPSMLTILASGLLGLLCYAWRRRK